MHLTLSAGAAPRTSLGDLFAACARRGFVGLELTADEGCASWPVDPSQVRRLEREGEVRISGIRAPSVGAVHATLLDAARTLGVPLVAPAPREAALVDALVRRCEAAGARLLLEIESDPERAEQGAAWGRDGRDGAVGLAWAVRPHVDPPDAAEPVLRRAAGLLRYVTMHGGGPETAAQTGHGVGAMMARLALARYRGPFVLTPSDPAYYQAWLSWLGRRSGWGCGSKTADPSLVTLEPSSDFR